KRLQSADLVVINNVEDEEHYLSVKTLLLQQGIAKVIGARVEVQDKMAIRNKRVALFCGIAKPLHFEKTLRKVGVEIVDRLVTLDHVGFARKRLEAFAHSAAKAGAEFLVCTEKDAVKLPKGWNVDLPIVPLKTRLEIVADMQEWQRFIVKIKEKIL
ncbi:MAG: tetraacyldisaccharide 4'-kinase, partial [Anaerolineae bacterium]